MGSILDIWRGALWVAIEVGAPFLLASLAVGLLVSLLQAATQLQENVLSFVPKLIAVGVVLMLSGSWVLDSLTKYTLRVMTTIAEMDEADRNDP